MGKTQATMTDSMFQKMTTANINSVKTNGKDGKESNIKVFVRCRPMNSIEQKKHAVPVLSLKKNEVLVRQDSSTKQFSYDHVCNYCLSKQ